MNSVKPQRHVHLGDRLEAIETRWLNDAAPTFINRTVWEYAAGRSGQTGSGSN